MKKYPLVSIIVPIYKTEKYLSRCIESILHQTYQNIEVILVDDGSPDKCPRICDNYALADKRVKVIHKKNGGISSARNAGLDHMTGTYVSFIDSDDFIRKDYIQTLLLLCRRNYCDISQCAMQYGNGNKFEKDSGVYSVKILNKYDAFFSRKLKSGVVGKLYKASLFEGLRFPVSDHFNYEDEALSYHLFYQSKNIALISKKMYYYFQSPKSTTRNKNHYKSTDFMGVLEDRIVFFKDKEKNLRELSEEYYMICLMLFYFSCRKDKENKNDKEEILSIYKKYYKKVMRRNVTPVHYKVMLSAFCHAPELCADIAAAVSQIKCLVKNVK